MHARLLLVDDHAMFRQGLRSLLGKANDIEVVGEAGRAREAIEMVRSLSPHVVLMDIAMPDLNGVEATRQIRALENPPKVVALSMQSDGVIVRRMFQAGASAYVLKDSPFEELMNAIRAVLVGRTFFSSAIGDVIVRQIASPEAAAGPLSPKEREVLQLLAEGNSTKEIASRLHVSTKTIDTHRQHIMDKLGIHNVAALTRYAIREQISFLETGSG